MKTLILAALLAQPAAAEIPAKTIEQAKACVVSIERRTTLAINGEKAGRARATGFIADLADGIIATNRHVTGASPAKYKVIFRDGSSAPARLLYYDPFNDFAFLKFSTETARSGLAEASFAPEGSLAEGSEVFMIGNNEGYEYSVKTGKVTSLAVHKGRRHTLSIQTSFDRTGGSSGSPVFSARGRVAAIHSQGSETSSFEVPAAYLKDALYMLKAGAPPRRGDPGVKLAPVRLSDALRDLGLKPAAWARILAARPGTRRVLRVEKALPPGPLAPGDIVVAVDGVVIGDDSYLFDKLMDGRAGGEADIDVARNGSTETLRVPVAEANAAKVLRFVSFSGGIFTPYTAEARLETGENSDGVLMVRADKGSPFYGGGAGPMLFTAINGVKIKTLRDLETAVSGIKDKAVINYVSLNLGSAKRSPRAGWLNADLKFWPLKVYKWSPSALDWTVEQFSNGSGGLP